ncbi:MAG: hypothetical protein AAF492_14590, partial [Verrucomicrobiota bacterium]
MKKSLLLLPCLIVSSWADTFPLPKNTQNPKDVPPTPQEAVQRMTLPEGFNITLFAGEPDIHQPIAFTFDDQGRLWVVEHHAYTGRRFTKDFRD